MMETQLQAQQYCDEEQVCPKSDVGWADTNVPTDLSVIGSIFKTTGSAQNPPKVPQEVSDLNWMKNNFCFVFLVLTLIYLFYFDNYVMFRLN